jgi:predicted TIM-barrel fold metal-dependent hydrolase
VKVASPAAAVRERLDHPVIDGDAHVLELGPLFVDYVRDAGGDVAEQFDPLSGVPLENLHRTHHGGTDTAESVPERRPVSPWWVEASNALDWASAAVPALLYRRLDELGFDFVVLYPTIGVSLLHTQTDEIRRVACHAYNEWAADSFGPFADRMRPVALVPMHTPEEALVELEHVAALRLGAALIPSYVRRGDWLDTYALDSQHDYDAVWARADALRLAITSHSPGMGWPDRASPTNFSFNHIGHFAASGELLSKALFFGGVTHRYPALRFAFLEGGVGVACRVYADLVSHWRRRGTAGLDDLDPRRVDIAEVMTLLEQHGDARSRERADAVRAALERRQSRRALQDDFACAGVESIVDIAAQFTECFAFGAEADDPLTPWAFARTINPGAAQLRVFFGSDIGHWDVLDFREPLVEAYEQLEHRVITPEDFRAFVFDNALHVYGGNPDFFRHASFTAGWDPQ